MATECSTTQFTADPATFDGTPLELDVWLSLGQTNLNLVTVTLFDYDIGVIVGPEDPGGPPVGPEI